MMNKPRYWNVAYPLAVTCLCVAPQEYFLRNWISCFEFGMSKIKVCWNKVSLYLASLNISLGKDLQDCDYERDDASYLDLPISMSRT